MTWPSINVLTTRVCKEAYCCRACGTEAFFKLKSVTERADRVVPATDGLDADPNALDREPWESSPRDETL